MAHFKNKLQFNDTWPEKWTVPFGEGVPKIMTFLDKFSLVEFLSLSTIKRLKLHWMCVLTFFCWNGRKQFGPSPNCSN